MLRWLRRREIAAFEREFDYDMGYARDVLAADVGALMRFSRVLAMSEYRRDVPRDAWYAAMLAAILAENCGPCTSSL